MKIKKGKELFHKASGKLFRVTEVEYTLQGELPDGKGPRNLYLSKKEIMLFFSEEKPKKESSLLDF